MRPLFLLLLVGLIATGCATMPPSISDKAHVKRVSSGCRLSISGQFPNMAHDPIGLLLSGRSQIVASIDLPSLEGRVDAQQIRVTYQGESGDPWQVKALVGNLFFSGSSVTISLEQHFPGEPVHKFDFNGTFVLDSPRASA